MKQKFSAITLGALLIIISCTPGVVYAGNVKAVIGVEKLMKSPGDYKGRIRVEGVVRAVDAKKKLVALIDRKEYDECKTTKCSLLTLPVKWDGAMPSIQDEVLLQGEVKGVDDRFLFVAKSLEKLPPRPSKKEK